MCVKPKQCYQLRSQYRRKDLPMFFYHVTNMNGLQGILPNEDHQDLEFWLSNSVDLNDDEELFLNKLYLKNIRNLVKDTHTYILSVTTNRYLSYANHYHYGEITLKLSSSAPIFQKHQFQKCYYVESLKPFIHRFSEDPISTILALCHWIKGFYVKTRQWCVEKEWRLVENAQKGETVFKPRPSKKNGYIKRCLPQASLIAVYLKKDSNKDQTLELEQINQMLHSAGYNFNAQLLEK